MAKRVKRAKRKKGKARAKWSPDERASWVAFLCGDLILPPGDRSIASVLKQLRGFRGKGKARGDGICPSFEALPEHVRHAAGVTALAMISNRPHTRASQLREQSEAICRFAAGDLAFMVETPENQAKPDALSLFEDEPPTPVRSAIHDLDDETLHAAIITTRKAIRNAQEVEGRARRKR